MNKQLSVVQVCVCIHVCECMCTICSLTMHVWLDNFCIKKIIMIMIEEDCGVFHDPRYVF